VLVAVYLALNAVVVGDAQQHRRDLPGHAGRVRAHPARLLRLDRGQPADPLPALHLVCGARARSRRSPARSCAGPNPTGPAARTCTRAEDRSDRGTRPPPNYSCVVTGLLCPARVVEGATRQRFAVPDRRIPSCSVAVPSPPRRPSRSYCSP
jgi:hypothetical protein